MKERGRKDQNCPHISLQIFPLALLPSNSVTPVAVVEGKFLSSSFSGKTQRQNDQGRIGEMGEAHARNGIPPHGVSRGRQVGR